MAKDVHDGWYTVFAYDEDPVRIVQVNEAHTMTITTDDPRKAQFISMSAVDSALLAADGGSDSLVLDMYTRDDDK